MIHLGSSPLTRGKPQSVIRTAAPPRLIPAHAGKTRDEAARACSWKGSSPLTRGKRDGEYKKHYLGRLIPAHAGKTFTVASRCRVSTAHPRSRGENRRRPSVTSGPSGSSPLTRGKLDPRAQPGGDGRLIPAHAGKTEADERVRGVHRAHPRSRGENGDADLTKRVAKGSSPLTRGKLDRGGANLGGDRLIPAHAGKTR